MATQEEMLAELRALNAELGLSENDGIQSTSTSTYEQSLQQLRALDEELASTPESFDEYVARRKQEDSRSLGEKTSAFTDSFITGAGILAQEGGRAIKQLFAGDVGLKEAKGVFQVGVKDFGRFAKTLGGAAMDNFYSDENEMRREYERYKDNFLYNQNVRTAMLDTFDEKGRDFVSFGANFVDPTMFIPIAGQVAKATSIGLKSARLGKVAKAIEKGGAIASKPTELIAKGTRKALEKTAQAGSKIAGATGKAGEVTSKVAAFPRDMVTKLASKTIDPKVAGSGILGAQVTGAFTGAVPGLGLLTSAEVAGYIANKSGRGMERVLTALGSEAGQKRFLQRLAMQADSPTTRKLALYAHKLGGTRMGDMAFNSLVNGISVSTLNGALAYASTDNIEELGQAMGAGFAMGGALPVGQPGMRAGRSQAARNQSSVNFLEAKLGQDQLKHFRKMDPDARLAFATVEEAGIKAPKLMFVDKNLMLETLRQDDPNIRQAPNAYFDQKDNTIYVNENGRASKSSKEAFDILTHELGHGFITQAIKDDPFFARKILEQYEAKPGEKSFEFAFTKDSAGAPIDSIMLNEDAKKIASAYDSIQEGDKSIGIGQDANLLAQEIGAEQFAMMMVDNPNYFNTIEPSLRQKLLEGSRKVLTLFGAVDGNTGNPLDVSISPILKRNKSIRNLYKNYTKQRDASIADKVDLADKGVAIKVRKGESADQAVERLYGKQGISLKEAGAFRIDNKKVKNELTNILNRVDETPEGGMSSERNPKSGRPQSIVGKQLSDEVKGVFTRKDPRGTINMLINDITESIRNRLQLNFLYRSGKPSKYSDNELKARVVSPVRFKVTGLSKGSTSAASLKMDAIDEAYLRNNVEVLAKEGFTKDPNKLIEQAREVARQALDDEEGRINPQGKYENELITAVFGEPTSAPQIRNAKLRQLLEDGKLKTSYRSYDVDALAGLVPTGKSGIAFDWFNIKNNYSPFDDKLFIPKPKADVQITDKLFMPASEAGAGKGNILFMPAGGDKLTATHNLSAEALAKADELGGLPVPSVGITKGRALEGFGEVTLLGTRPLVDPELGVPAFGSDVYSKRFPREKYKPVKTKLADSFIAKYKPFENETGGHELSIIFDALVNSPDLSEAKHRFVTSELAKIAFLKSKGKTIRVPKRRQPVDGIIDKQLVNEVNSLKNTPRIPSDPEYKLYSDYLRKAFDRREKKFAEFETNKERSQRLREKELNNLFDENGLVRMGVGDRLLYDIGRFDNLVVDKSKLRDRLEKKFTKKLKAEYEQWATQEIASLFDNPYILLDGKKVPLTLETATDSMKGRIRAVEKNMTFGPGEARSVASPRISSIQEMRNRSDSIVPKDEFETYKETIQEPVHKEFRDAAFDAFDYESAWMAFDNAYAALASYFRSNRGTQSQRMKSALRQFGFKPNEILVEKAIKAAEVLRDAPTEYFEAKPQRAVKLEEFAGAIIPKKANPKVKELADKYGWEVKTYDSNKPETRQTAVRQLANRLQRQGKEVLFMPSDRKAPTRQPANRITRQAPAMPGNRFMPAVSAGAKSAERFR